MLYAQFFQNSTGYAPGSIPPRFDPAYVELIEATGDRSVVIIDGRLSADNVRSIAETECKKRGFVAWQIFKGESFVNSTAVSMRYRVAQKIDNSASSAYRGA